MFGLTEEQRAVAERGAGVCGGRDRSACERVG